MSLRNLEFAIAESLTGIARNGLMSMASISTVGLSLAILGGFVLLALGLNNVVQTQLTKFEIAVWLDNRISDEATAELTDKIRSLPHVASAELVTAEATWEKIKRDWHGQIELSGVEPGSVSDHFRVKLRDPRYTAATSNAIRKMPDVAEVIEGRHVVAQVVRFADLVKLIGGCTAGVLFLVAAFIISNTIRLTVYARRREIKIMQLVGATNWFIRLPFVFEGTILGAIGGGIACLLVLGGSRYIIHVVTQIMPLLGQFSSGVDPARFFGSLVILGCIVGAAGSLISIRRFLKA